MFSWANKQLERLSETLAPPPTNANGQTCSSHRLLAALVNNTDNTNNDGRLAGEALALAILREEGHQGDVDIATAPLNVRGMSALHLAAKHGASYLLLQELIQVRGVNVDIVDRDGNTALHHAAMANNNNNNNKSTPLATVQLLVETYGANVLSKNNVGETPYDVAVNSQAMRGYLTAIMAAATEAENSNTNYNISPLPPLTGSPFLRIRQEFIGLPWEMEDLIEEVGEATAKLDFLTGLEIQSRVLLRRANTWGFTEIVQWQTEFLDLLSSLKYAIKQQQEEVENQSLSSEDENFDA